MRRKGFTLVLPLLIMPILVWFMADRNADDLDWIEAYAGYVLNDCSRCRDYFEGLDTEQVRSLDENGGGAIYAVIQAYASEAYEALTPEQRESNRRIESLAILMLEKGADINNESGDPPGVTPLYAAVLIGSPRLVEFLLAHGASRSAGNGILDQRPIEYAKRAISRADSDDRLKNSYRTVIELLSQG